MRLHTILREAFRHHRQRHDASRCGVGEPLEPRISEPLEPRIGGYES